MNETTEWIEEKYQEVFNEETLGLERRRAHDPNCTLQDLQGTLKNLYILDGNNWTGRGQLQDSTMSATIAAYEGFIEKWKKELEK
ncbi:MAG TPA: hypothetical protein GXZ47_08890 [Treponema sp.]|nr:hypothetical protein [Treponema sp.]